MITDPNPKRVALYNIGKVGITIDQANRALEIAAAITNSEEKEIAEKYINNLIQHLNAIKIQKLFRGYFTRKHANLNT